MKCGKLRLTFEENVGTECSKLYKQLLIEVLLINCFHRFYRGRILRGIFEYYGRSF